MSVAVLEVTFGFKAGIIMSVAILILSRFSSVTASSIPDSCFHLLLVHVLLILYLLISKKMS